MLTLDYAPDISHFPSLPVTLFQSGHSVHIHSAI